MSMPSTGLLPFLQKFRIRLKPRYRSCQCPQRAYFHFYLEKERWYICMLFRCQCPQRAYFHFYDETAEELSIKVMCQCPQRAYFHFYRSTSICLCLRIMVCQCPQRAYFHFYYYERNRTKYS